MSDAPSFFVGVDGGATRCRARVRDTNGRALAEANGPAANVHVDFASAAVAMRAAAEDALQRAGVAVVDRGRVALGLGLAGVNDLSDAGRVVALFSDFARALAANDATTACIGAHAGADGGLVIAGTGSAAIARVAGRETIVGGRGFTLGDDGSGARIGLEALRAATRAADGLGPMTPLAAELLAGFDGDVVALVRWARDARPGDYGAFAPRVFAHAADDDAVARKIVDAAAEAIGALARRALALGARRVALAGGVGAALRPYLDPETAALLTPPLHDATDGAILMAGGVVASTEEGRQ